MSKAARDKGTLTLCVGMRPFAKQRPRFSKSGGAYMDSAYQGRKETLGWLVRAKYKGGPLKGKLSVVIELAFKGKGSRADADNMAGGVLDALNGILWEDDSQISSLNTVVNRNAAMDSIGLIVAELA